LKGEGYDYICVARNKPVDSPEVDGDSFVTIKQDKNNKVEAALIKRDGESILYCKSFLKAQKEQAMKTRFYRPVLQNRCSTEGWYRCSWRHHVVNGQARTSRGALLRHLLFADE